MHPARHLEESLSDACGERKGGHSSSAHSTSLRRKGGFPARREERGQKKISSWGKRGSLEPKSPLARHHLAKGRRGGIYVRLRGEMSLEGAEGYPDLPTLKAPPQSRRKKEEGEGRPAEGRKRGKKSRPAAKGGTRLPTVAPLYHLRDRGAIRIISSVVEKKKKTG